MPNKDILVIIACRMLEDELVYLLKEDMDIDTLLIIRNEEHFSFVEKIERTGRKIEIKFVTLDELSEIENTETGLIAVLIQDFGLHAIPEKLKMETLRILQALRGVPSGILFFYGLCGNAFKSIEEFANEAMVPVFILKDERDETVDDCICALLGGRIPYRKIIEQNLGVFFLTPMWAINWREMAVKTRLVPNGTDDRLMRIVFEACKYNQVIAIDTGLGDKKEFYDKVEEFCSIFNLRRSYVAGNLSIMRKSYEYAKKYLARG